MSEKTLLVELEKDKVKIVEKKLALQRQETEKIKEKEKNKENKYSNAFSSKSFKGAQTSDLIKPKQEEKVEKISDQTTESEVLDETQKLSNPESKVSSVIEKPNYDYIETLSDSQREKIFKIEKKEQTKIKTKPSRLKTIVLSILFAIFGVWGIVNIAQIDSIGGQIAEITKDYYEINLPKYLKNLVSLDATNSENMENLFETIPDEDKLPSEIIEKSNWFDRFCNFIAGLFGG